MGNIIADHKRGTTWDGLSIKCEVLQEDGATLLPVDLTGVVIVADFKIDKNSDSYFSFKTANNTIIVPYPANGEFLFMPRFIDYYENYYHFTVKLFYPNGTIEEIISSAWKIY